jgi:hypothetical protein
MNQRSPLFYRTFHKPFDFLACQETRLCEKSVWILKIASLLLKKVCQIIDYCRQISIFFEKQLSYHPVSNLNYQL